jgi:hypothetical protein
MVLRENKAFSQIHNAPVFFFWGGGGGTNSKLLAQIES